MGQRHQIYIRLPKIFYNADNINNRDEKTIGFHHQWLYGATAVQVLDNFLAFADKARKQTSFIRNHERAEEACKTVLSYLPKAGLVEELHELTGGICCENPACGDNNDGITIIDLAGDVMCYAFGSIGGTEGKESLPLGLYSAAEYFASYYPDRAIWHEVGGRDSAGNGEPEMLERLARLRVVPVLDVDRVREIFPAWNISEAKAA